MSIRDRKDAKYIKPLPLQNIMYYLNPHRCTSVVYINQKVDVTELVKYVEDYNQKNDKEKLTYFHAFVTAFGKLLYERPLLNRFIINKRLYERKEMSISFVAKKAFTDKAEESINLIKISEDDNLSSIKNKIITKVKKVRNDNKGKTNSAIDIIGKFPKPILAVVMSIVKFADRHDLLPASFKEDNVYYSSILVSNLGSIGCGSIYHHLSEFGTNSCLITIGKIHKEEVVDTNGKITQKDICDFGINIDERIADGFYFAKTIKLFEEIISNPKSLEEKINGK